MYTVKITCRGRTIDKMIETLDDVTQLLREGYLRGTSAAAQWHGPKKTLTLTCRGDTADDVMVMISEVRRLVGQGITYGFDRRGAGRFHFQVQETATARRPR